MRGLAALLLLVRVIGAKVDIEQLHVPEYVLRGRDVRLACQYTAVGTTLYAVKWYKNNKEFYRYLPQNTPPKKTFKVTGFTVDVAQSDESAVQLRRVTPEATDSYMCEVISETPEFWTDHRRKNLTVVDEPEERPSVSGLKPSYRVSDRLSVNCSSGPAIPAPKLAWYINDDIVPPHLTRAYRLRASEYLYFSVLQLSSQVRHSFFEGGIMKLKCSSSIGNLYWQSTETSIAQLGNREARSQMHGGAGAQATVWWRALLLLLLLPVLVQAVRQH